MYKVFDKSKMRKTLNTDWTDRTDSNRSDEGIRPI